MGYAIAEAGIEDGHEITLITGPVALAAPDNAIVVQITTSDELYDAVHQHTAECDVLVMCAAVSDYKPQGAATHKMKKQVGEFALHLKATRDILASLPTKNRKFLVVGFAAETQDMEASAQRKLLAKNCDMIVANDVSRNDSGMESDENEVTIFFRNGERKHISRAPKKIIAREILKKITQLYEKSLTKKT